MELDDRLSVGSVVGLGEEGGKEEGVSLVPHCLFLVQRKLVDAL